MPLELDGITAGIHCEGMELECYNIEKSHDGKSMTCWVASEVGKTFSIVYSMPSKHGVDPAISCLYLDGVKAKGLNMYAWSKPYINGSRNYTYSGRSTSATTMRPFTFANIRVTDDDSMEHHTSADIGNIALKISTARLGGYQRLRSYKHAEGLGGQTVHERAKKMCSHSIELGSKIEIKRAGLQKSTQTKTLVCQDQIVEFIFRYRPLDVLKAQGIVPHDRQLQPSPGPKTGTASPVCTDSPEVLPGFCNIKQENINTCVEAAALAAEILAAYVNSSETSGPSNVKREDHGDKGAPLAVETPVARMNSPEIPGPSKVKREDSTADVEAAALAGEIQAAEDKLRKLRKKERKMALLKELAELESDGDSGPSTSQRPAKRVKRESSVIDLTSL